ncbi:hypothetical protein ABZX77_22355 [Streptomyces sp. NPDC004237]|uniref:hypothetical protein n=1 Tax=Streptomyces sp. NPDC004237 TaxID=3154455 RepID=UPI0033AFE042
MAETLQAVSLLDGASEPGEYAIDPGATGSSGGFIFSNGQHEEYPDADSAPLEEGLRIVAYVVGEGRRPTDAPSVADH